MARRRGDADDASRSDPFVERLRPDPAKPPQRVVELEGLLGDSDRPGFRRLYFTRELTSYAEFRPEDVLYSEVIPREEQPLQGLEASRIGVREGAQLNYTRTSVARGVDDFDLDVRVAALPSFTFPPLTQFCPPVWGDTVKTRCGGSTCGVCVTIGSTCATCVTECNQTCSTCVTCGTQCGQATCETCYPCGITRTPGCRVLKELTRVGDPCLPK